MALKFRRRQKLFPGFYVNFSSKGISTTVGVKGLSVNFNKTGTYLNTGIPGTGFYDRKKISGGNKTKSSGRSNPKDIIIPDNEDAGTPIITNGLSLCKIHHAAYDTNIVGISSDYEIHVRRDILKEIDGPMLKYGIQNLHNQKIILPKKKSLWPDKERLEMRFENFKKAI